MRPYWVFWTYIANYSDKPVKVMAYGPADAVTRACHFYSDDFKAKATVFVSETEVKVFGPS